MRAVVMREFGPPEVLEPAEVDEVDGVQAPGEVVIEVELANVTFVETQVRAGRPPHPSMLPALPAILGNGVGGTVTGGRRVVASLNGTGGYAERAVVPTARLIEVPDGVDLRDAVALLADGRTALALAGRPACARATPSWSRPRPGASGRCLCRSPATPAPGSWRWPASRASSRSRGISGRT